MRPRCATAWWRSSPRRRPRPEPAATGRGGSRSLRASSLLQREAQRAAAMLDIHRSPCSSAAVERGMARVIRVALQVGQHVGVVSVFVAIPIGIAGEEGSLDHEHTRRDIARLMTILNERESAAQQEGEA